jgi:hypothetical protein
LIEQTTDPTHSLLAVMDYSFIAKSGKAMFGRDWYWNGCANRVEQGLEVSLIGVIDIETQMGYALSAQQTFAQKDLPELTRMDQYLYHLDARRTAALRQVPRRRWRVCQGELRHGTRAFEVAGDQQVALRPICAGSTPEHRNRVAEDANTMARSS